MALPSVPAQAEIQQEKKNLVSFPGINEPEERSSPSEDELQNATNDLAEAAKGASMLLWACHDAAEIDWQSLATAVGRALGGVVQRYEIAREANNGHM